MINRAELKSLAKEQIRGNIGALFLCGLVYLLIAIASVGTMIGHIFIIPPLYIGILMIFLGLTRGEEPRIGKMFEGFQVFGKSILVWYAMYFFTFLWMLLFIIPGFIKMFSYMFAPYIIAEKSEMSALDAIKASKRMTDGHKMELFILYLSFIPWFLVGTLSLGIAYIYVLPYFQATVTNAYNSLKNNSGGYLEASQYSSFETSAENPLQ